MAAALYRRYRPETFAEMIGQSQVTEPLMTALRTGRIGHAYLFSGPRGCGKTTSARILARCLNCVEGPTDTPCGSCASCVELSRHGGGSLDVVEIDAASHGGVDDARDLRERAVFAPARDRFKIFIIDEAHMVTPGGFNALLKIVEEPPPHVKFVFATTEPEKVIGTIRSRTHHYPFRLIAPGTLTDYVQSLCESEGVLLESGVLALVVRAGAGSVRDTLSILDQLIGGSESETVTTERAAALLGFTSAKLIDDVVRSFGEGDAAAAFCAVDRVVQAGQDPRRFVEDLLERLRDLIVVSATSVEGAVSVFRGVPELTLSRMFEQSGAFGPGELSCIADTVSAALNSMHGATAPRLQLELMVARVLVQAGRFSNKNVQRSQGVGPFSSSQVERGSLLDQTQTVRQGAGFGRTLGGQVPNGVVSSDTVQLVPDAGGVSQTSGVSQIVDAGGVPDAARAGETAASIRDFLREQTVSDTLVDSVAPQQSVSPRLPHYPDTPRHESPHPQAGAASFGRPVSDVLSESQLESIGGQSRTGSGSSSEADVGVQEGVRRNRTFSPQQGQSENGVPGPVHTGFDDLLGVWPELLDELFENDRAAWSAVKTVQPLAFHAGTLTLGFASRADLDVFKTVGATALREVILAAVGVTVKYQPKALPNNVSQPVDHVRGTRRDSHRSATSSPDVEAEDPHRRGSLDEGLRLSSSAFEEDPSARVTTRLNALGPALAAPAWAEMQADTSRGVSAKVSQTGAQGELRKLESGGGSSVTGAGFSDPELSPELSPDPDPAPELSPDPDPGPDPTNTPPNFTRYGEAVVREVLGAKFITEHTIPNDTEV